MTLRLRSDDLEKLMCKRQNQEEAKMKAIRMTVMMAALVACMTARAQTLTTLYQFGGTDGANPLGGALVQGPDGDFYGTTSVGGTNNFGTVFKITAAGTLTTLYQFNSGDGADPEAGLVLAGDGDFYGTTSSGGTVNLGTVFKITSAGTLTTLYSFTGQPDGDSPDGGLVQGTDANFYGTTLFGGTSGACPSGCGTVFQITSIGTVTILHSFNGIDGEAPRFGALALGSDGNFYGTTARKGT